MTETQANGHSRRILIVDDNDLNNQYLRTLLTRHNFTVDVASDGQSAIDAIRRRRPDVVLLDMQMPGMDGRETLSAIRHHPAYRNLKVFAVTGADRSAYEPNTSEQGFDRWFSKPLNPRRFVAELAQEMSHASA